MASPSDRPAPRFGPRVRTYEQQITAEFEQEIAELNGKLYERDMEIERLRAELELERRKDHAHNSWTNGYEAAMADYVAGRTAQWPKRAASRDEERDHA